MQTCWYNSILIESSIDPDQTAIILSKGDDLDVKVHIQNQGREELG